MQNRGETKGSMFKSQKPGWPVALRFQKFHPSFFAFHCVVHNEKYNFVLNDVGVLFVMNQFQPHCPNETIDL